MLLNVIDKRALFSRGAIFVVAISVGIFFLILKLFPESEISPFRILSIAGYVATVVTLFLVSEKTWRLVWRFIRRVDPSAFPDVNGCYEGTITPSETEDRMGISIDIKARVHLTLTTLHIEFRGADFKSKTLSAILHAGQGQNQLYYSYNSRSKNPARPPYDGFAVLDIEDIRSSDTVVLEGRYFTERGSRGHIKLERFSKDSYQSISTSKKAGL